MVRAIFIVAVLAATAYADTQPWAVGITDDQRARAKTALDEGNALFLEKRYTEALAKYEAAIAAWDHPAIRFNIVRCLIQLDRIVEASDNLERALAYGAAPLEVAIYNEALSYKKLFENQITELTVTCEQPGVAITLDGQQLGTCPTRVVRRVKPGSHQVVGVKTGLLTRTMDVIAIGGQPRQIAVKLDAPRSVARVEHRWPTWIPWLVFGGGLALVGGGVILDVNASSQLGNYNQLIEDNCKPIACTAMELAEYQDVRDSAERQSRIAVGLMVAGGAVAITGGVMLYLNRGRTVYTPSSERIAPVVIPSENGLAFGVRGAL